MTLQQILPIFDWLPRYRRDDLPGDLTAGIVVAIMLAPQAMAYAVLAGLPPYVGLYASIAPLLLYSLFGSSRSLAVGPVAIASLMVASALGDVAAAGTAAYVEAALVLAFASGLMLMLMGLLRVGFLVNFLSHPVISGFTSAAAVVIGLGQLKHLLGLEVPRTHDIAELLTKTATQLTELNWATAAIGVGSVALLLLWRGPLRAALLARGAYEAIVNPIANAGPLVVVSMTTLAVWRFGLDDGAGVAIVGALPPGLPSVGVPSFDPALWQQLLPAAALISLIGFLESVSVAKALASKRRQRIDANQELTALGAANIGAAFTGGYPVAGGFGRSVVNYAAGAVTPMASIVTAILMAITLVFLTPLFYYLPKAALAAIIVVAVVGLVDVSTLRKAWAYNKADAVSLVATFAAVLAVGVEVGIAFGVLLSIALYLWRTSRPHFAIVGRLGDTEHFRNVERHSVDTSSRVLAIRVDESLYFANAAGIEDYLLAAVARAASVEHVVLICSAVNFIDASALETLESLVVRLRDSGVTLNLAEVKGPVMDKLKDTALMRELGPGQVFLSTHEAMQALTSSTNK